MTKNRFIPRLIDYAKGDWKKNLLTFLLKLELNAKIPHRHRAACQKNPELFVITQRDA